MAESKTPITGLTLEALTLALKEVGKESYRAKQIYSWLYKKRVSSFAEMSDLSKQLRTFLEEHFYIPTPQLVSRQDSPEDRTEKFLYQMSDVRTVETVLIPAADRLTQCVSSQVGCAMGCRFCNTGDMGLFRNLKTHEIVDQVLQVARLLDKAPGSQVRDKITNIVYMGMGEPMHNLEALCESIAILTSEHGMNLSHRKITVSTSGLVPQMLEFGKRSNVNLAVSLNATTDELRDEIMPINKRYPLAELLRACRAYPLGRTRRITFEYVVLKGLNDTLEDATRIVKLLKGIPSKVNLIPYNPHPASPYERPEISSVYRLQEYLLDRGMNATVRISKGKDILAACGQLRSQEAAKSKFNVQLNRPAANHSVA